MNSTSNLQDQIWSFTRLYVRKHRSAREIIARDGLNAEFEMSAGFLNQELDDDAGDIVVAYNQSLYTAKRIIALISTTDASGINHQKHHMSSWSVRVGEHTKIVQDAEKEMGQRSHVISLWMSQDHAVALMLGQIINEDETYWFLRAIEPN